MSIYTYRSIYSALVETEYFELRFENLDEAEKNFYRFSGGGLRYEPTEFLTLIVQGRMDESACELSRDSAKVIERTISMRIPGFYEKG